MGDLGEVPLAQLTLLKLKQRGARGRGQEEIDLAAADAVYDEIIGNAPVKKTTAPPIRTAEPAPAPAIRFDALLQYTAEESEQAARSALALANSLRANKEEVPPTEGSPQQPSSGLLKSDLEFDQREQLEDLAHWRKNLMSAVLPDDR